MHSTERAQLKSLISLLSDCHQEIAEEADQANTYLITAEQQKNPGNFQLRTRWAARRIEKVEDLLRAQEARCERLRQEIEQIRLRVERKA